MYVPQHFLETDLAQIHKIIHQHPLGILIRGAFEADHLPFELDPNSAPHGALKAHVARANPLWQQVAEDEPVLVIFRGAEAYVSPNGYPSKAATHRQVPTWNYEVVHVRGHIRVHQDERFLRGLLARLTRHHEQSQAQPWKMGDAPADYLDAMLQAIVGIEIHITGFECKRKLSQNKDKADRLGVIAEMRQHGALAMAESMEASLQPDPKP